MPKTKKSIAGRYVDGYVLVLPKKNLGIYRRMAERAGKVWKKYGVLDYKECVGEDLPPNISGYPILPFPKLAKLKRGEIVVFSYIVFKSRAHRDQVNAKVWKDPLIKNMYKDKPMPFDTKRMAYGGFRVFVDA